MTAKDKETTYLISPYVSLLTEGVRTAKLNDQLRIKNIISPYVSLLMS